MDDRREGDRKGKKYIDYLLITKGSSLCHKVQSQSPNPMLFPLKYTSFFWKIMQIKEKKQQDFSFLGLFRTPCVCYHISSGALGFSTRMLVTPQVEVPLSGQSCEGGFGIDCQTSGPLGMRRRPTDLRIMIFTQLPMANVCYAPGFTQG